MAAISVTSWFSSLRRWRTPALSSPSRAGPTTQASVGLEDGAVAGDESCAGERAGAEHHGGVDGLDEVDAVEEPVEKAGDGVVVTLEAPGDLDDASQGGESAGLDEGVEGSAVADGPADGRDRSEGQEGDSAGEGGEQVGARQAGVALDDEGAEERPEGGLDGGGVCLVGGDELGEGGQDGLEAVAVALEDVADGVAEADARLDHLLEGLAPRVGAEAPLVEVADALGELAPVGGESGGRGVLGGQVALEGVDAIASLAGVASGLVAGKVGLVAITRGGVGAFDGGAELLAHGRGAALVGLDRGEDAGALALDVGGGVPVLREGGAAFGDAFEDAGALGGGGLEGAVGLGEALVEVGDGLGLVLEIGVELVEASGCLSGALLVDLGLGPCVGEGALGHLASLGGGLGGVAGGGALVVEPALLGGELVAVDLDGLLVALDRLEAFGGVGAGVLELGEAAGEAGQALHEVVVLVEDEGHAQGRGARRRAP